MRMKSIVEFMSEGCLSCRGNSINLWNEMEKWIELTNRQRVNEWAAVNGNEQAPPTQAPNARGKPIQLQSIILCEDDWWNWFGGVEWVVFVGGYRRLQAAGNQPTKETSQLPSSFHLIHSLSLFNSKPINTTINQRKWRRLIDWWCVCFLSLLLGWIGLLSFVWWVKGCPQPKQTSNSSLQSISL